MNHRSSRRSLKLGLVAAIAAGSLMLSACAGTSPGAPDATSDGKPVTGGNLTIAAPGDPRSLDPVASAGPLTARYAELMYEALFAQDKTFTPRPMLVDTYELSDDQLSYTLKLRSDVKFHDGSPLRSADVVASLNRYFTVDFAGRDVAKDIASIEATDENTVTITLVRPRYPFISELGAPASQIFKASSLEGLPATGLTQEQAIGTGPYKLKSWTPGQEIVLERFEDYSSRDEEDWGGFAGAKHAYLDTLTFTIVTDSNAQVSGLQTGRWDFIEPNIDQFDVLKADSKLTVAPLAGANLNAISTNQSDGSIFAKSSAREALSILMDRAAIVAAKGGNDEITKMSPAFVVESNKRLFSMAGEKQYEAHDTARAKKLFQEAGLGENEPIRILSTNTFPWLQQTAVLLQSQLKAIGIESTIDTYDWASVNELAEKAEGWDIMPMFFNAVVTSPAQMRVLKNLNGNSFSSEKMNGFIADYNASTSDEQAHDTFEALQNYLWSEYAYVLVDTTHEFAAYTNKLKGYEGFYRIFWNSWLAK